MLRCCWRILDDDGMERFVMFYRDIQVLGDVAYSRMQHLGTAVAC